MRHLQTYDPDCTICANPARGLIERAYENCVDVTDICKEFFVERKALDAHARTLDIDIKRLNNTDKAFARVEQKALEALENDQLELTTDHLLRLLEHKDKKEGRVINRVQVSKPSVVVINNIPSPLATIDDVSGRIIEAESVELLPASTDTESELANADAKE